MRKVAIILVLSLLTIALVGCGSESTNTENQTTRSNIEPAPGGVVVESGTKGVSDTKYMENFWWGMDFETGNLKDGVYRGAYILPSEVTVQFAVNGNIVSNLEYLKLGLEDKDYINDETFKDIKVKYDALLQYLEGKDIRDTLNDLYSPEKWPENVDDTLEIGKVISAIHDALNRGVYYTNKE